MNSPVNYILLLIGVPYFALAALVFTMSRDAQRRPRWEWLWAFGSLFGMHLWLELPPELFGQPPWVWAPPAVLGLAYLCLAEFGRISDHRYEILPRWVIVAGFLLLLTLLVSGQAAPAVSLALGAPAGLLGCGALVARGKLLRGWRRAWTAALGVTLLLSPWAELLRDSVEPVYVGSNWATPVVGLAALACALFLEGLEVAGRRGVAGARGYYAGMLTVGAILGALLAGGGSLAWFVAGTTLRDLRTASEQRDGRFASMISVAQDTSNHTARSMSGAPDIVGAVAKGRADSVEAANRVLDRYASSFGCDVAYVINQTGIVVASSNRARPESLVGKSLADRDYFQSAMAGQGITTICLGTFTRTRGIYGSAPIRSASGTVIGVAVVKNELESLEAALGHGTWISLVDPAGTIWLTTRPEWRYQMMWNRPQAATLPVSAGPGAATGATILPDQPLYSGERVTVDGELCEVNRTPAGPEGWALISFIPLQGVYRATAVAFLVTACAVVLTLITASSMRLRTEHALAQQQEQVLSVALKEMERLMSVLSHDLRAPLAASHCSVEYLLSLDALQGEPREAMKVIGEQQLRMGQMVTRLLDAIRIRNGVMEWSWENLAVSEVLRSAHRTVCSLPVRSPDVQVVLDAGEAPAVMRGDAQAIGRLVTNLGTNAVRHTKRGIVRITAREQCTNGSRWLVIETADTGDGISPAVLPLLGRPFVLGGSCRSSGGSGLGLAIAAGICAAHGGRLTVRSEVHVGTTFTAWLRADLAAPVRSSGEPSVEVLNGTP